MKTKTRTILSVAILCLCGFAVAGCKSESSNTDSFALNDQGEDEDAYVRSDDHGHDHPEHGKRGGHMVQLSNDSETEVHFDEESELFSVYIDGLGEVTKVQMTTTISDEKTVYEFERTETPGGPLYGLKSPELATAVKMGKDAAQVELMITTSDGDLTAAYEHHSH